MLSTPTFSAVMTSAPVPLMVPPMTLAPAAFSTGIDSPVTIDSSTVLVPSVTEPSTGTASPGRTRNRSPAWTCSSGTSSSVASLSNASRCFGRQPEKRPNGTPRFLPRA